MDAIEPSPAPNALGHLTKVPIAELSPDLEQPADKSILATVTLVWPYSSATKSLSLLLAEPDFRLRRSKGQVKVTFHGRVAEKVAESHVGIGDSICLGLNGIKFTSNQANQQTPGRSIAWDAQFENGVFLEVRRPSQDPTTVIVEYATHATVPQEVELAPPATPVGKSTQLELEVPSSTGSWGSPAFLKPARPSFASSNRPTFDPFAEEDGFVAGKGRKKPRYSLSREDWRIVDEPDSPREADGPIDWEQALDQELDEVDPEPESADTPMTDVAEAPTHIEEVVSQDSSPVFAKPSLELTGSILERRAEESNNALSQAIHQAQVHLPTDTPKIRPIPSPGLPVPSPLVSDHMGSTEYFPSWTPSETQETRSTPIELATPPGSFIEAQETETELDSFRTTEPDDSIVNPEETNIFDAGFPLREELESTSDPYEILKEQPDESVQSFAPINEQPFAETDYESDIARNQAPSFTEMPSQNNDDVQVESIDTFQATDEIMVNSADFELRNETAVEIEPVSKFADESQPTSVQFEEEDTGRDEEPPRLEIEHETDEHHESSIQTDNTGHSNTDLDRDALHALERMIGLRETEGLGKGIAPQERFATGDEIQDSSMATGALDTSQSPSSSSEDDEMIEGNDQSDERSVDDYDSQNDYDEEAYHNGQDEFSVDESDDDESEQESNYLSQPQTAQTQEIIVLDSDSEDEATSKPVSKSVSQSPEQEDRSSDRFKSTDSDIAAAAGEAATDEEEEADSWDVDSEEGGYAAEENESGGDESENGDEVPAHGDLDARVHDSDKDDESAPAVSEQGEDDIMDDPTSIQRPDNEEPSFSEEDSQVRDSYEDNELAPVISEQDEDEIMDDEASVQGLDNEEPWLITDIKSPVENQSPSEEDDDSEFHLADTTGNPPQDEVRELDTEQNSQPSAEDHATDYYAVDGAAESQISAAIDAIDVVPTAFEPLGSPSPVDPQSDPQPPTVDATEEATSPPEPALELEATSMADGQGAPLELEKPPQPLPAHMSPESGTDEALQPVEHADNNHGDDYDIEPTVERAEIIENAERTSTTPEAKTGTDALQTPSVVVQPPIPDRHASGLRSKLSYFAPLATLIDHYNAVVDTISIIRGASPIARSKGGSKDWFTTVELTDPSMAGSTVSAQIFRRYKSSIPSLVEGAAVLLRDFKVQSFEHNIMLVSVDSSAWAVFDRSGPDAEVNGPPVEYDSEERAYASGLRRWYAEVGSANVADYMLQASIERDSVERELSPNSEVPSESGSPSSRRSSQRRRRSHRRVTIHELRDGTRYTEVGSPNSRNSSVHELRDGTLYANL